MAESQVPLETAGVVKPPPLRDFRPGGASAADGQNAPVAASPNEEPAATVASQSVPAPSETAEQAPLHLAELNGSAAGHAAEPQLDIEAPQAPLVSDAPPQIDAVEPPLPVEPALPLAPDLAFPMEEPQPETFAAAEPGPAEPPAGHVPPPAEIVMEVSPILSALDAADQAAAEADRSPPPAAGSDDVIALPHVPALDDPPPDAPAPTAADADPAGYAAHLLEPPTEADEASAVPQHAQPEPRADLHATAAKIADEASATAAALESLKRLLDHKLPLLDPVPVPVPPPTVERAPPPAVEWAPPPAVEHTPAAIVEWAPAAIAEQAPAPMPAPPALPPIPAFQAAPRPVAPPPMVPLTLTPGLPMHPVREPARRRSSVGGFLAGFALSWVIGAILYAYLAVMG